MSVEEKRIRFDVPVPRMMHIDEFTIWLLRDRYEHTALCDAGVAWRDTEERAGAAWSGFCVCYLAES